MILAAMTAKLADYLLCGLSVEAQAIRFRAQLAYARMPSRW